MFKKVITSFITLFLLTSFAFFCFADNENAGQDMVNDVRNVVGGAENAVEDAAKDISNGSKEATGTIENDANNMMNNNTMTATNDNGDYTATRTATDVGDDATLLGMDATTWTWVIMAIAAVAIIALIWYYTTQNNQNYDSEE